MAGFTELEKNARFYWGLINHDECKRCNHRIKSGLKPYQVEFYENLIKTDVCGGCKIRSKYALCQTAPEFQANLEVPTEFVDFRAIMQVFGQKK